MKEPDTARTTPLRDPDGSQEDLKRWQRERDLLEIVAEIGNWRGSNVSRSASRALPGKIMALFQEGCDPNTLNKEGHDSLALLGSITGGTNNPHGRALVAQLLDAGLNPIDRADLAHLLDEMADQFMRHMAVLGKRGAPVVGADGSNHFHWMARWRVEELLLRIQKDRNLTASERVVDTDSIHARRHNDGATVLHVLWSSPDLREEGVMRQVEQACRWLVTQYLVNDYQADIMAVDRSGRRVLDLIERTMNEGRALPPNTVPARAFIAQVEQKILETRSPLAGGERKAAPRL